MWTRRGGRDGGISSTHSQIFFLSHFNTLSLSHSLWLPSRSFVCSISLSFSNSLAHIRFIFLSFAYTHPHNTAYHLFTHSLSHTHGCTHMLTPSRRSCRRCRSRRCRRPFSISSASFTSILFTIHHVTGVFFPAFFFFTNIHTRHILYTRQSAALLGVNETERNNTFLKRGNTLRTLHFGMRSTRRYAQRLNAPFRPFGGQAGGGERGGGGSPLLSFSLALPTLRADVLPHPTPGKVFPLVPSFVLAVCNFSLFLTPSHADIFSYNILLYIFSLYY